MTDRGAWNRAARRSGGDRRVVIALPALTHEDADILSMETKVRAEFGEAGVREFRAKMDRLIHGVDCVKVTHSGGGYLHDADDDSPYDVDGVSYCGRCHHGLLR